MKNRIDWVVFNISLAYRLREQNEFNINVKGLKQACVLMHYEVLHRENNF